MSKLEIISELLVNELTDFEKDVNRLEDSIAKAENLQVKFDTKPLEGLISKLQKYGRQEEHSRNEYLQHIQSSLEQAKIYPNWAVVSFFALVVFSCVLSFYTYSVKTNAVENEKAAYKRGEMAATEYINLYLSENPKALESYKKWADSK
ncbi:DUF6730 family protein [uncultured Zobellia sp.]|uniref:DUF6730 family protein n=1 Tax=uncultured Zobellia sp. TaxID=255433 RepID=UPI002594B237|nr:DUF6730 family protein [uncultured Zobellia sp.]